MKGISHLFPFIQQFIQNLCISGRGAVQQYNSSRMNPFRQFCNSFLWIWLVILLPVYIGKAPEKCVISQFSGHRQILCTVDALWGAVKFCHFFSCNFPVNFFYIG